MSLLRAENGNTLLNKARHEANYQRGKRKASRILIDTHDVCARAGIWYLLPNAVKMVP